MSTALALSVAFWNYDRTMPIADGRVGVEGCAPRCLILRPQEMFPRAFQNAEFDVTELSFSRHAQACARGGAFYAGIPVFPSRSFRHASIYVRTDRGIDAPRDLRGRTLGVNNYDDTAAVVVRGFLRDDYGLGASDIRWCVGDMEAGQAPRVRPASLPPGVVEISGTLDEMLADGRIDGVVSLVPPPCVRGGHPRIARLFRDYRRAEEEWFARTRIFPIMHLVGVRKALLGVQPWLPQALYDAFCRAKDLAVAERESMQAAKVTLPWAAAELERNRLVLGQDYWPYGIEANRTALATQIRYLREDGLLAGPLEVSDLFVNVKEDR